MDAEKFPIVGIGSSAGGLEALEQFLRHVPKQSGMAFVIIQHLDPTHKGIMAELLQRVTAMPISQVQDRTVVQPDCVYIIPPNKDMSILHGVLHLLDPVAPRGLRLPIDLFFRSLADDQQERSIGVILSGMGSDGTLGIRAIKERAGVVFVQDPASAKFDGMPCSAIEAGLADIIAPIEELPARIIAFLHHSPLLPADATPLEDKTQSGLEKVVILIRSQTGHDFSLYKKSTIYRRIERRMGIHQIEKISFYVRFLRENPQEIEILFKELLIGVTSFFRDAAVWERLKSETIPNLLAERSPGQPIRAWIPGCSTGEEAYSLAIIFRELMEQGGENGGYSLQIFATDLDQDAITRAREGVFPANIAADISQERLERFFVKVERGYQVAKHIREMVIFAPQNVIMDPPFTKLDIISCRNLLIYLAPEMQKKLLPLFHYSLNKSGVLVLGSAETIGGFESLFVTSDNKLKLYRRRDPSVTMPNIEFPSSFVAVHQFHPDKNMRSKTPVNLQAITEQMILNRYSPAAVLVNEEGDILYISGKTGRYLEPAAGKATLNIFAMAREGLRHELPGAFSKALRLKKEVVVGKLKVGTNGGTQVVNLMVQPVVEPSLTGTLVLIAFVDVVEAPEPAKSRRGKATSREHSRITELESENQRLLEELNTSREEMQTSHEELKSSNEELQSTNEELQSTNEELTTSKEEMQSLNEELQTVNAELQSMVDQLSQASSDMKNLLNSTDIATVFLDETLRVRRFTEQATNIFKLIPGDVGRPLSDLDSDLNYNEMYEDSRKVLQTLVFSEREISTRKNRWFKVRIMPYRTLENVINGLVMTFVDITIAKRLESKLRETNAANTQQEKEGES
ncbi:PAS domain-containing protein [Myxococcota bacterium]|nr:PAS domain-containing protein [Myxococcota bacterium]MBU1537710.1 PAS domain-containing protein [Myxococcota bacterium]